MMMSKEIVARKMVNGSKQEPLYPVVPSMHEQLLMPELVGAIF
jgi:hypothetical protein